MILFLFGPDTYRSKQKLSDIIARYQTIHKSGLSFKTFCAEEENSFDEFRNSAQSVSMFGEKKLVVVRGAMNAKEFARLFMLWQGKEALRDGQDTICVFLDDFFDEKSEIFRWMRANSKVQEFPVLFGAKLIGWIRACIAKSRLNCDARVPWKLAVRNGGDLWKITNELQKLKAYKAGGRIISEDLDIFSRDAEGQNAFALVDALVSGNKQRALTLLNTCGNSEDEARRTFGLLCWKMRTIAQSGRFHKEKLKKAYGALRDLDVSVKTGKMGAKYALEEFIFGAL